MIKTIRDGLLRDLGRIGTVIAYVFAVLLTIYPLAMCGFPWWVNLILLALVMFTDIIGGVVSFAAWVWSFVVVISGEIGPLQIVYFVLLGLYVIFFIVPLVLSLISSYVSSDHLREGKRRAAFLQEQDEHIAQLKIPNPLHPGSYFESMDDLEEYSEALRRADAAYRRKHCQDYQEDYVED